MSLRSYEAIYEHGKVKWLKDAPPVEEARVIVTILPERADKASPPKHCPSPRIAGKGRIVGDIITPVVPIEDWDCAK